MPEAHPKAPLYSSPAPQRGVAKSYSVYADRVELALGIIDECIIISRSDIVDVTLVPGGIREILLGTLMRRYPLMSLVWAMVLDLGILGRHILLRSRTGPIRYYRFTPDDPAAFMAACYDMMDRVHPPEL